MVGGEKVGGWRQREGVRAGICLGVWQVLPRKEEGGQKAEVIRKGPR